MDFSIPGKPANATWLLSGMVLVIAAVLGFEHAGGYVPCKLCLAQREPYYAAIPLAALAVLAPALRLPDFVVRAMMAITGLLMLYTLTLAVFHAGVEWKFWLGPADCGATAGNISGDVADLLGDLASKRAPSCDAAALRVFGLSFAGWNVLVSAMLAGLAFRAVLAGGNAHGSSTLSQ